MKRDLGVERIFPLGEYKNIKLSSTLRDIPEELAQNERVAGLLYLQQALSCEIVYRRYFDTLDYISKNFTKVVGGKTVADSEEVMKFLMEEREQTLAELLEEIKKTNEKETK